MAEVRGTTFVRPVVEKEEIDKHSVTYVQKNVSILTALSKAMPSYEIVPRDFGVDLETPIDVRAKNMSIRDFLSVVASLSGYEITVTGNIINLKSFITKTYNMSTYADARNGQNVAYSGQTTSSSGDQGTDTTTRITIGNEGDQWATLLAGAAEVVRAETDDSDEDQDTTQIPSGNSFNDSGESAMDDFILFKELDRYNEAKGRKPFVEGIRSSGIIIAGGKPEDMRALDQYFERSLKTSMTVFNVSVETYEVAINHSRQKAIDWDLLKNGSLNGNPLDIVFGSGSSDSPIDNLWGITGSYESSKATVGGMINFLENFGTVTLQSQPNITVRNGVPASIRKVEELSFIGDFEQAQDQQGQITVTPVIERISVGVTLGITARLVEGEQIQIDILPIISQISGSDIIDFGEVELAIPRVIKEELSTSTIAFDGESIQLGGLITKRLVDSISGLPIRNRETNTWGKLLFDSTDQTVERSELVMVVTPSIVQSVY
jgi:type II secretory pathway component GspD/PulD (secretin)